MISFPATFVAGNDIIIVGEYKGVEMNNKKLFFFSGKRLNCYVRNPIWMYREK